MLVTVIVVRSVVNALGQSLSFLAILGRWVGDSLYVASRLALIRVAYLRLLPHVDTQLWRVTLHKHRPLPLAVFFQ